MPGITPIYTLTSISQLNTLLTSFSGEQNTQTFQFNVRVPGTNSPRC